MRVRALPTAFVAMVACAAAVVTFETHLAFATPNGSDSGCSGKTGIPNDVCTACSNCHTGGPKPTVAFTGPATIDAGAVAQFTFTVTTGAAETGVDIAATNGVTLEHGTNTQDEFSELTQPAPQTPSGGKTDYTFTVTGPPYAGTIELWGSGVAANGNGSISGDNSAEGTMMITVVGPPNPGGGGATGNVDAGDGTGLGGGFFPDGGVKDVDPSLLPEGGAGDNGNGLSDDDTLRQNSGNCSVNPHELGRASSGLLAAGLVVCALLLAGRRRRRK